MSFVTETPTPPANTSVAELAERLGESPTLLAIWAHPDDESYLGAGLMAEVARRGGRVVNVTATLGEHGTDDPVQFPPSRLTSIRRAELETALAALGVAKSHILGFGDAACQLASPRWGARRVGQILDEVAPDAVLTFGTDGVTGHADHRAVARWVNASVAARGGRIPIIATAANAAWSPSLIDRLHTVSMFYPGYPERERNRDVLHAGLGDELLDVKLAALRAHASQVGPVRAALGEDGYQQMASVEAYRPTNRAAAMTLGLAASFPCAA